MKMKIKTTFRYHLMWLERANELLDDLFRKNVDIDIRHRYQMLKSELGFFKMIYWALGSSSCDELHGQTDWHLCFAINNLMSELTQIVKELEADYKHINLLKEWPIFEERIQQLKPQVKEICILVLELGAAFKFKSCRHGPELFMNQGRQTETHSSFIDLILHNLECLLDESDSYDLIAPVKHQIAFILQKFEKFPSLENDSAYHVLIKVKNLGELVMSRAQTWLKRISCLVCLYWIDGRDESLASTWGGSVVFDGLMPYNPASIVASHLPHTMIPQLLGSYFDSLLDCCLVVPMKNEVEILREGLIFLLSFATDPPEYLWQEGELILVQTYAMINALPSLIRSICSDHTKGCIFSATNLLCLLQKIETVKAKVREVVYVETQHLSQLNPPRTSFVCFLDSLLVNLKKMIEEKVNFIPSMKLQIEIAQKELAFLRSLLQDEYGEYESLWIRTIDVVYHVAYISKLCHPKSFSVWYAIICLPNVTEVIKLLNGEIQKIRDQDMCKNETLCVESEMKAIISRRIEDATPKMNKEAFIGIKEDAELIIDSLIGGNKHLTIISISGSPGRGKTTLAKKIYNDQNIHYHFHKMVWCYVSKECKAEELLNRIGYELIGDRAEKLKFEDLAEILRKHLKKNRYLIVMDDIWDLAVWNEVQMSFPDDENGSRILFTSRNHDLTSKSKLKSILFPLALLSEEQSFELMKEMLFPDDDNGASLGFIKIAKQIAKHCKGLPLAIALITALLQKTERKLELWHGIAENLKCHLANEGCGHIIELSYKYLPDHLKSCFLYFGAFARGTNILASKLKKLWIAEGFIEEDDERLSSKDLAKEYLDNLVSQNLVTVTTRTSMGGIKRCNVHDLLYDLCSEKAKEENYLNWADESSVVMMDESCSSLPLDWTEEGSVVMDEGCSSPPPKKYSHHRLCIGESVDPFIKPRPLCTRKELPTSQVHSCRWDGPENRPGKRIRTESISWFLQSLKVLKVLDLEGVILGCKDIPKCILSMIHLTYLALRYGGSIDTIPSSIADMWKLETLIVKSWRCPTQLPVSMLKMMSLRQVDLARPYWKDFDTNSFAGNNIETLGTLHMFNFNNMGDILRKLPRLRKLSCRLVSDEYITECFSMLSTLTPLESLWLYYPFDEDLDDRIPRETQVQLPKNLKKLSLWGLCLPWSAISTIGKQLPNLQFLKLSDNACMGYRWSLEDGAFSKLRYLNLYELDIEEIDVSCCDEIPFPCLEQLLVERCTSLKEIPSIFEEIDTLKAIRLTCASRQAAESVRRILQNQQDFGNQDLQVFIS